MSKCYCGRSFRYPLCDGTHALSDERYQELSEKVKKLKQPVEEPVHREIKITKTGDIEQYSEGYWWGTSSGKN
jgi:CDGSH-type Zn-finger protein